MSSYIPMDLQAQWERWVDWGAAVSEDAMRRVQEFPGHFERFHLRHIGPSSQRVHGVPSATSHVVAGTSRILRDTTIALLQKAACGSLLVATTGALVAGAILYFSRPPRCAPHTGPAVPWPKGWAPGFEARESLVVVLLAWGALEDTVEPTLTLALELRACGHRVRVVLRDEHVEAARSAGLADEDLVAVTVGAGVDAALLDARTRLRSFFPGLAHYYHAVTAHVFAALYTATEGADVLVGQISPLSSELASIVAKKRKMPLFFAAHEPLLLPSARAMVCSSVPGEMPLLRYQLLSHSLAAAARPALAPVYRQLGLSRPLVSQALPMPDFWSFPVLASFPSLLFPSPSAYNLHHQHGPWTQTDSITDLTASTPDSDLLGFLKGTSTTTSSSSSSSTSASSSAPVLVTFGPWCDALLPAKQRAAFTSMLYLLLKAAGVRAIVDRSAVDPSVPVPAGLELFFLGDGELSSAERRAWLLPQCRAAVIPGDSSLVLAALRAGCPVAVVAQTKLQVPWADVVEARGVGRRLDLCALQCRKAWAHALGLVLQPAMRVRAAVLADALNAECASGVGRAVDAIHESLAALHLGNGKSAASLESVAAAWGRKSK